MSEDRYRITDQHSTYFLSGTVVHWIYKIWTDDNHDVDLTDIDIMEKIDYVHNNPVRAGLVDNPAHYIYSSAIDYAGGEDLVKVVVV